MITIVLPIIHFYCLLQYHYVPLLLIFILRSLFLEYVLEESIMMHPSLRVQYVVLPMLQSV
jgi:hypothetical protein